MEVEVREQIVSIKAKATLCDEEIHISAVYANCDRRRRVELWEQIKEYRERLFERDLWSVIGGFN